MRGKQTVVIISIENARNIPAYAGKTRKYATSRENDKEHPRVCGENALIVVGASFDRGTSPRMRGKQGRRPAGSPPHGNIPAYAGKTPRQPLYHTTAAEHPRVCGENADGPIKGVDANRNIPAYAGKTLMGPGRPGL